MVWRARKGDVIEDIFLQVTKWTSYLQLKIMSSVLQDSLQQEEKKDQTSPNIKFFSNVQVMHDAYPNGVPYMWPKSPNSGGFVRPPIEVSSAGCSLQVHQCFKPLHTLQSLASNKPQQSSCPERWIVMSTLYYKGLMIAFLKTILYSLLVIPSNIVTMLVMNYTFNMNRIFYLSAYSSSFNTTSLVHSSYISSW